MSVKKNDAMSVSRKDRNLFSKSFSPMEMSFCVFVKKNMELCDFETVENAFCKYGQFICPELGSDACALIAKSRYEYLIGDKTETQWLNDLKLAVCDIEGERISISRQLIDIDFLMSKEDKTNDERLKLGCLLYEVLSEEKAVDNVVFLSGSNISKITYSFLYALRSLEGDGSLLNPIDFRDFTKSLFRGFDGRSVSFDDLKNAVFSEVKNIFKLISRGGSIESQFVIAEKSRCDDESSKTKAEILKNYSDRCLFLSSIAVSLGVNDLEIKNMYIYSNEINSRVKKVLDSIKNKNDAGVNAGI